MKQTAVEWLANHWKKLQSEGEKMSWQQIIDITELAKAMEMEQRFKDFKQGFHSAFESLEAANNSVQSKTFKSE